jgi:hypothetical protein
MARRPAQKTYTCEFEFGQSVGIAQSIFEGLEKPNFKICGGDNALTRGRSPMAKALILVGICSGLSEPLKPQKQSLPSLKRKGAKLFVDSDIIFTSKLTMRFAS